MQPQICCSLTEVGPRSDEWWEAWFGEIRGFYLYHAELAQQTGAARIAFGWNHFGLPGQEGVPAFAAARWEAILEEVHEIYEGDIGYTLLAGNASGSLWPTEAESFSPYLDFWTIALWGPVAPRDDSPQQEFDATLAALMTGSIARLAEATGIPVVLTPAYPSGSGSAGGTDVWRYALAVWEAEPGPVTYDPVVQARAYEALMRAVAVTPSVVGVYPFGYWFIDLPRRPRLQRPGQACCRHPLRLVRGDGLRIFCPFGCPERPFIAGRPLPCTA